MQKERVKPEIKTYDFVVIGAGLAGTFCALAAARHGARTALVDRQVFLGGNATPNLCVDPEGAMAMGYNRHCDETGIPGEMRSRWDLHNDRDMAFLSQTLWQICAEEPNLDVFLKTEAIEPIMAGKKTIKAVRIRGVHNEKETILKAKLFADCGGDGDFAAKSGADFTMGREARSTFNESMAPEKSDGGIMGATLRWQTSEMPFQNVPFTAPDGIYKFKKDMLPPHGNVAGSVWWLEYGAANEIFNRKRFYETHLKIILGFWDYLKKSPEHDVRNRMITWIAPDVSRRESRRFYGDYMLNENDVVNGHDFEDRIGHGGWPIDLHPPGGILSGGQPPAIQRFIEPYSIPLRCLYSKNIRNLFFAGRDVSVSHVALGTVRVEWTCGVMGQGAGTAAALCIAKNCLPRAIYKKHRKELIQQLLKDDVTLLRTTNEDPDDIARGTKIEGSSSMKLEITNVDKMIDVSGSGIAQTLPVSARRLDTLDLFLRNKTNRTVSLTLTLYHCGKKYQTMFEQGNPVATAFSEIKRGGRGWVSFDLKAREIRPGSYWWLLEGNGKIEIGRSDEEIIGLHKGTRDERTNNIVRYIGYHDDSKALWRQDLGTYCMRTFPAQHPFDAENILNGMNHPELWPNLWISDPHKKLPQSFTIHFHRLRKINLVQLTFHTGLNRTWPHKTTCEECIKDYEIQTCRNGRWTKIVSETDNFLRLRRHKLKEPIVCNKLRVRALSTHGSPSAQVFEIRVY